MTAELGRQPWLVYGLMRTADGSSPTVSAGNVLFTLLGLWACTRALDPLPVADSGRSSRPGGAGTGGDRARGVQA